MTIEVTTALSKVESAAGEIFEADNRVRSVGIGRTSSGYAFVAIRNVRAPQALSARSRRLAMPSSFDGIPVRYQDSKSDPVHLARMPLGKIGSAATGAPPEQQVHSPLACGLEIQNYDHDLRSGEIARGYVTVGTLGCFVDLNGGGIAILSNNHVLAGENGARSGDRIAHPGLSNLSASEHIANLSSFASLVPSPYDASISDGTVALNEIDAAVALLSSDFAYRQAYLDGRVAAAPADVAIAAVGERVHKVGRTTGLTFGTIKQVGVVVGPIGYAPGPCWFRQCLLIETDDGKPFSDHGDSGSAVVGDDGKVVGLLFAGNDTQTYACAIQNVLDQLNCRIA